MPYNELLADRIRRSMKDRRVIFREKEMMGGLAFMVNDKMCVGIVKEKLMARVGPDAYESALRKKGCKPMDFTGRPMKGFVFVEPKGIDSEKDLDYWLGLCLAYNPKAKSAKKK